MASLIGAVVIRNAKPELEDRRYLVKRAVSEKVVEADIFVDGHEALSAVVCEERLRLLLTFPMQVAWHVPIRGIRADSCNASS
jgi:Domain of unknown function (DUF3416)